MNLLDDLRPRTAPISQNARIVSLLGAYEPMRELRRDSMSDRERQKLYRKTHPEKTKKDNRIWNIKKALRSVADGTRKQPIDVRALVAELKDLMK